MTHKTILASIFLCLFLGDIAAAENFSQWRGPNKNGFLEKSPALLSTIPEEGPKLLWKVELPGDRNGGFSSPVGADGKAYAYVAWMKERDITERRLDKNALKQLGHGPGKTPEDLLAKTEAARLSEERKSVPDKGAKNWAKKWIEENLEKDIDKNIRSFAEDRLCRGPKALSIDTFKAIEAAGDKTFESQEALDTWMKEQGFSESDAEAINKAVPDTQKYREDTLVGINLDNGKIAWQKSYPTGTGNWGGSSTPCVADGKVFAIGNNADAYCLDAATGEELWKLSLGKGEKNSSFAYRDGTLYIQVGVLIALHASDGKELWRQKEAAGGNNSPVFWTHEDKTYVIASGGKVCCVEPADGTVLWSVPGEKNSTPAVSGNTLAVMSGKAGLVVYRMTPEGAEKIGEAKASNRGGSPGADEKCVYMIGKDAAVCIDAATGETVWQVKGQKEDFASPIIADGKLICHWGGGQLAILDRADGKTLSTAAIGFGRCTSPGLVDGRILGRTKDALVCYDLRAE